MTQRDDWGGGDSKKTLYQFLVLTEPFFGPCQGPKMDGFILFSKSDVDLTHPNGHPLSGT